LFLELQQLIRSTFHTCSQNGAVTSAFKGLRRKPSGMYGFHQSSVSADGTVTETVLAVGKTGLRRKDTQYGFGNRRAMEVIPDGLVGFLNGGHTTTIIEVAELDQPVSTPRCSQADLGATARRTSLQAQPKRSPRGSKTG